MARRADIVPHTHWDREWHRPFQAFRMRLVDLVDRLLDSIEADPGYAHFMLDGQMAVIDDYLAMRPHEADRIRRLAVAGRISVGPWYILMDEFLVSGETIVRDMEMGLDRAAAFGGAMEVGYLPDMFGHVAQMPQILQGFGLGDAVVWRGVPAAIDAPAFRWRAPDGSEVLAEYLTDGYSNGALLPTDAKELLARIDDWADHHGARAGDPVLWMNGTDHLMPQAALGHLVAEADAVSDDWDLRVCSLADHVAARRAALVEAPGGLDALTTWTGELRSGARSNLLMGVTSNRVDVRQRAARAEVGLERVAEPLWALFAPAEAWPQPFLDEAWGLVVRNAAHDSVCACSVDPVADAVLHRYDEAHDVVEGLTTRILRRIGEAAGGSGTVVVNPGARARRGPVELLLTGVTEADAPPGVQVLAAHTGDDEVDAGSRANLAEVIVRTVDVDPTVTGVTVDDAGDVITVRLTSADDGPLDRDALRLRVHEVMGAGAPATPVSVRRDALPSLEVVALAAVEGFSWARVRHSALDVDPATAATDDAGGVRLANGLLEVVVDPTDGTWSLDGVAGYGRLVDGGDHGDTYNWCPPPAGDVLVDRPDAVAVEVVEVGPVRARVRTTAEWTWPEAIVDGARTGSVTTTVVTTLTAHAGDPVLDVTTTIDNRSRDHRLRVHLPLPRPAQTSEAGCAFATVTRGLDAEGGPTELPLPTFPARDHVTAGGLTVVVEGVAEYELVEVDAAGGGSAELALTLLRCTGLLSQGPMETRPVPAGPIVAAPGAQMPGVTTVRYGLAVDADDPRALADTWASPLLVARPRGPHRADTSTPLRVDGAAVSSLRRRGGRLELRVVNLSDEEATVAVDRAGWHVDLRGRPLARVDAPFPLRPWGIATLSLDEA
jgi:hypothetical protein